MEDLYLETDKQKLEKLENHYEMVMDFEKKSHEKNQKRIRIGLRCLYIIPAIFLFLLMVMKSSKIIFLAFWIISLFILAVYLIVVEYMDYNLQNHINKLEGKKNGKVDSLIQMDRFEKNPPKFPKFLKVVSTECIAPGPIFDIKVTKANGETIESNIRLNEEDMELMEALKNLSMQQ